MTATNMCYKKSNFGKKWYSPPLTKEVHHAVASSKMMWLSDPTRSYVEMALFQWFTKLVLSWY